MSVVIERPLPDEHEMLQLSKVDALAFVAALEEPILINENLLNAARRYKNAKALLVQGGLVHP